jgi:hypothetical protein
VGKVSKTCGPRPRAALIYVQGFRGILLYSWPGLRGVEVAPADKVVVLNPSLARKAACGPIPLSLPLVKPHPFTTVLDTACFRHQRVSEEYAPLAMPNITRISGRDCRETGLTKETDVQASCVENSASVSALHSTV